MHLDLLNLLMVYRGRKLKEVVMGKLDSMTMGWGDSLMSVVALYILIRESGLIDSHNYESQLKAPNIRMRHHFSALCASHDKVVNYDKESSSPFSHRLCFLFPSF